jgi:hypothetical protein
MLTVTTLGRQKGLVMDAAVLKSTVHSRQPSEPEARTVARLVRRHPFLARLWRTDPLLTGAGLLMLAALLPSLAGLWLDPRVIGGAPAWLKPAKFAASTAVYMLTLAWVFSYLPEWPRVRRLVGSTTAAVMILEVAIIDLQAWRGTTSHFNVATPLDAALFSIMGLAIVVQTVVSVAVAVVLWRQRFGDRAMGWALRVGMIVTIAGASTGGLMTKPTATQLADAAATGRLSAAGAHTVGAPDGGPGLPVTGWSTRAGDLRVPHFVGLHALQALSLLAFFLRRRPEPARTRLVLAGAAGYIGAFAALLGQALAGVPLIPFS